MEMYIVCLLDTFTSGMYLLNTLRSGQKVRYVRDGIFNEIFKWKLLHIDGNFINVFSYVYIK